MNWILKYVWRTIFRLIGTDVSFDIKYRDISYYLIELEADFNSVASLLKERNIIPQKTSINQTRIQIVGCEMRNTQIIGDYNEVSIQVPIVLSGSNSSNVFAHLFLPVNSEKARWGGVEVNGFPKLLAFIDIHIENGFVYCVLKESEKLILDFKMELKSGKESSRKWTFIGNRRNRLLMTKFDVKGNIYSGDDFESFELNFGDHLIASILRKSIISIKPTKIEIGNNLTGVLRKPVEL